jgi:hypothetical protein
MIDDDEKANPAKPDTTPYAGIIDASCVYNSATETNRPLQGRKKQDDDDAGDHRNGQIVVDCFFIEGNGK